jgi:acetyl esterase/lipase
MLLPACRDRTSSPSGDPQAASSAGAPVVPALGRTLADARSGFHTRVRDMARPPSPPPEPPARIFSLVRYASPAGSLAAYVTPRPAEGGRHPAIVWVHGGFDPSIDEFFWSPAPPENDQTARAFREAGVVLMLPSLRGGNDNPGKRETMYGEVDDVIAAGDYLANLDYVDPQRVYLGGHSTGGTLALLVAESTSRFRGVFSFGPVGNVKGYADEATFDTSDETEVRLRSPMYFVSAIRSPTFVFEGTASPSNAGALSSLTHKKGAAPIHIRRVEGVSHFSILSPVTRLLAQKILRATGDIEVSDSDLKEAVSRAQ